MKSSVKCFCFFLCAFICARLSYAADSIRLQPSFIIFSKTQNAFVQDIYYSADSDFSASLSVQCVQLRNGSDSLLIFRKKDVPVNIRKRRNRIRLNFREETHQRYLHPQFAEMLRKLQSIPVGTYHISVTLKSVSGEKEMNFFFVADSALSFQSPIRSHINQALSPEKKWWLVGIAQQPGKAVSKNENIQLHTPKFVKKLAAQGLTTITDTRGSREILHVYYKDWYAGYYECSKEKTLSEQVKAQREKLSLHSSSLLMNDAEGMQPLFTQMKDIKKQKKDNQEVSGNISVAGYAGTGQEEYSEAENNYYEIGGNVEVPVLGIPVNIEGYYTSQDQKRKIKAGYVKLHYDTRKSKEELLELLSGYKSKYEQTEAKGKGLESVYQTAIAHLQAEKSKLGRKLSEQAKLSQQETSPMNGTDVAGKESSLLQAPLNKTQTEAAEKYRRIQEIEQKIGRYQQMLQQYKNAVYFDSLLAYDKIKESGELEQLSYKQLLKRASPLLPEGKAKGFAAGISHLDAGIFSRDVSKYTMNGQMMKGVDIGYDLGFCKTTVGIGRTEYAGRDGSIDRYSSYSATVSFKPVKSQEVKLIYYGYMPSSSMLNESFFHHADPALPSFTHPVHITGLTYHGEAMKNVWIEAEGAASFSRRANAAKQDNLSYSVQAEGSIPKTPLLLEAGYEHIGQDFQNSTLPVTMNGTDRYHAGAGANLFHDFLQAKIDYHYLVQQHINSTGGNFRWGFEVKTKSKRYPSVSLAYKPFSTFRTYDDTLDIPQRPLTGSVWIGKLSYQIKKKDYSLRFTSVYNYNKSEMDTVQYNSSMLQLNTIYIKDRSMIMLTLGKTRMTGTELAAVHAQTKFGQAAWSYNLDQQWTTIAGAEAAFADFGLSRYALNAGAGFRLEQAPLMIRANFRYLNYKLTEAQQWRPLLSGSLQLDWQFRFKIRNDKDQ